MRQALVPIHAHDDSLEPQRSGYCVEVPSYGAQLAAEKTGGFVTTVPRRIGSTSRGPVLTWEPVA